MESLVYTRDELRVILNEFFTALTVEEFMNELKALAPDEKKIAAKIEKKQREILAAHNIDPEQGIRDLARVRRVFASDKDILEKLVIVASKEEAITNEVLGGVNGSIRTPNDMQQMQQMLHNFPQLLAQLQLQFQQNPQLLNQMTPQQQAQYQHLVTLAQQSQQGQLQTWMQQQQQQIQQHQQQPQQYQQPQVQQQPQQFQPQQFQPQQQQPQEQPGYLGSFLSMFGYGSAQPAGRTMSKDDELD